MRKLQGFYLIFLFFLAGVASAQNARQEYLKVITVRADKIVAKLGLSDSTQYDTVRTLIVDQYDRINTHHEAKQAKIQNIKEQYRGDKDRQQVEIEKIKQAELAKLYRMNAAYVSTLSKLLTEEQVVAIKDGMTYGVLPKTYGAYQEMIPDLTTEQKQYILSSLTEARELAMAQPGSKEKHAVFGKYKGRINNYLSKEGYDLKEEGKRWEERRANKGA